jgi:hypothetical protein
VLKLRIPAWWPVVPQQVIICSMAARSQANDHVLPQLCLIDGEPSPNWRPLNHHLLDHTDPRALADVLVHPKTNPIQPKVKAAAWQLSWDARLSRVQGKAVLKNQGRGDGFRMKDRTICSPSEAQAL